MHTITGKPFQGLGSQRSLGRVDGKEEQDGGFEQDLVCLSLDPQKASRGVQRSIGPPGLPLGTKGQRCGGHSGWHLVTQGCNSASCSCCDPLGKPLDPGKHGRLGGCFPPAWVPESVRPFSRILQLQPSTFLHFSFPFPSKPQRM